MCVNIACSPGGLLVIMEEIDDVGLVLVDTLEKACCRAADVADPLEEIWDTNLAGATTATTVLPDLALSVFSFKIEEVDLDPVTDCWINKTSLDDGTEFDWRSRVAGSIWLSGIFLVWSLGFSEMMARTGRTEVDIVMEDVGCWTTSAGLASRLGTNWVFNTGAGLLITGGVDLGSTPRCPEDVWDEDEERLASTDSVAKIKINY